MFSRICTLLTRNFRSGVGVCPSFQATRIMLHVQKDSRTTARNCAELPSFMISNPACGPFVSKPLPQVEPIDNVNSRILDFPNPFSRISVPLDEWNPLPEIIINEPPQDETNEKQAARLVVIRRRKMKKHKLKKLRKKMRFEWAKVRQRRELRKEKLFQAKLVAQMKEADAFDAAEYVSEKLKRVDEFSQLEKRSKHLKKEFVHRK